MSGILPPADGKGDDARTSVGTVLTPDYPIQTERLTLRAFREDDFAGLYAIQSRPDVARYLYWSARDEAGVRESLALKMRGATLTDEGHWLSVAVVLSETGRLDARNTASARTLERLGMRREARFVENEYVKGEWVDEAVYALLAEEWRRAAR
jgi:RimJ/RimL family protein N-acetyltransferase